MKNKNKEQIFNGDSTINTNKSSKINRINKTQISFRVESQNLKIDRIDKKDINIENKENLNIKELSLKMNQSHTSRDRPINKLDRVSEIKEKESIIVNKSQSQIINKYKKKEKKIKFFDISKIKDNIQIPKEYINKIYYNLLKEEDEGINPKPKYNYMKEQKEINEKMRSILIDWLIDVHHKFRFSDETLFMTVFIIDRYLSVNQITKLKLQLLGITSLLIACKHEEIDLPKIDDFIYITDNAYVKDEVIRMENYVLKVLNFELLYPSPIKFYEYLSIYFNFDKKMHLIGKYLMESFLVDIKCTKYKPSIISSACCYIVLKFFKFKNYQESYDKKFYSLVIDDNSKYSEHDIKDCARDICLFVDNINKTKFLACQKKYSKPELEKVSILIMTN